MQPVAEAGALDRLASSAAVAGLHARHPEHPPQDGGPARVPSHLQPALRPVRECSTCSAPPPGPQSEQPRRPCEGRGWGPPGLPSRAASQSRGGSDARSCALKGARPSTSQGGSEDRAIDPALLGHFAFPAEGLRKGNDLPEPVRRGGPRSHVRPRLTVAESCFVSGTRSHLVSSLTLYSSNS